MRKRRRSYLTETTESAAETEAESDPAPMPEMDGV